MDMGRHGALESHEMSAPSSMGESTLMRKSNGAELRAYAATTAATKTRGHARSDHHRLMIETAENERRLGAGLKVGS